MKHLLCLVWILVNTVALNAQAQNKCETDLSAGGQMSKLNCDLVDKAASCSETKVDPDAVKKRFQKTLEDSATPQGIDRATRNWKNTFSKYPTLKMLYVNKNDYSASAKPELTPVLDWFVGSDLDKEKIKTDFIQKYADYAKKFDCTPIINQRGNIDAYVKVDYPANFKIENKNSNSIRELEAYISDPEYKKKAQDYFKEFNSKASERFVVCNPNYIDKRAFTTVAEEFPPCAGQYKEFFADNKYDLSSSELTRISSNANSKVLSACIKERLSRGAEIQHVNIKSSASSLNNTASAAQKFCKKGFLGLSEARARTAQNKILPQLFKMAGSEGYEKNVNVLIDAKGANGNGTSGPCAYTQNESGQEVIKSYYLSAEGKKELEDSKYVSVQVTFKPSAKSINDKKSYYSPSYSCRQLRLSCQDTQ